MRRYELSDLDEMFKFSGFSTFHIEFLRFDVVNKKSLIEKGKRRKKEATEGELDLFAYFGKVIWLVEWTTENSLSTEDFDGFKTKLEKLNSDRDLLRDFIDKIGQKNETRINVDVNDARVIGLYVNPTFTEIQSKTLEGRLSSNHKELIYIWDCDTFQYFKVICGTLRRSSRYEIFTFFNIAPESVFSKRDLEAMKSITPYPAIEIEKGISGFPTYTFKINPEMLIERCYVLRNEGWRSDSFQRMIMLKKLASIREYILTVENTSFANNIIISPSPEINPEDIIKKPNGGKISICLPFRFSSFCIIDGQHRLLAFTQDFYGESKDDRKEKEKDEKLRKLAEHTEIIATLVKFSGSKEEILKKQTNLFKDINSTQTKVKTDFIYNLREIIDPQHPESIANKVIRYMNNLEDGVFKDKFEIKSLPSYRGRMKRSSIVKWGLCELVDIKDSFFPTCYDRKLENPEDISSYVKFCGDKLNKYFFCIKEVFEKKYKKRIWDNWRKTDFMLLSTSSVVGFLRLYRHFIKDKIINDESKIKNRLKAIRVNFRKKKYIYVSSQWAKLEEKMFNDIRRSNSNFGDQNLIKR